MFIRAQPLQAQACKAKALNRHHAWRFFGDLTFANDWQIHFDSRIQGFRRQSGARKENSTFNQGRFLYRWRARNGRQAVSCLHLSGSPVSLPLMASHDGVGEARKELSPRPAWGLGGEARPGSFACALYQLWRGCSRGGARPPARPPRVSQRGPGSPAWMRRVAHFAPLANKRRGREGARPVGRAAGPRQGPKGPGPGLPLPRRFAKRPSQAPAALLGPYRTSAASLRAFRAS